MGFLTIFYKYVIQQYFIVQIFLLHPSNRTSGTPRFIRHPYVIHVLCVYVDVNKHK